MERARSADRRHRVRRRTVALHVRRAGSPYDETPAGERRRRFALRSGPDVHLGRYAPRGAGHGRRVHHHVGPRAGDAHTGRPDDAPRPIRAHGSAVVPHRRARLHHRDRRGSHLPRGAHGPHGYAHGTGHSRRRHRLATPHYPLGHPTPGPRPHHHSGLPAPFPRQYADPESGLHYNYFRYYDPHTTRYLTPDPLGLTPAPNPHTYITNPHAETDPLGSFNCNWRDGAQGPLNPVNQERHRQALTQESAESMFTKNGELTDTAIRNSCEIIPGTSLKHPPVKAHLTADGSSMRDWAKYSTPTHQSPYGDFQVHYYYNSKTGSVAYDYDYKAVMNARGRK
ncbi:RHS repeat-associated core domain-containing protein [Streptomyces sp. Z26]|uniref:RHS repeat-associated core domain-containing protein n=1 Tax=Streptomyces sp. Z26 TaxID=2500177 RepID=UPI001F0C2629|nr:RHS repeat-associated core domain-containing protein [Streptomyces sp. Z26]